MDEPNQGTETNNSANQKDSRNHVQQGKGKKSHIFRAYSSITNIDTQLSMNLIRDEGHTLPGIEWVLTEKVHGANFSFILNEEGLFCAKRSGLLEPGDRFYGWEKVRDLEAPRVTKAKDHLMTLEGYQDITQITIFGELFGGMYPHKEVPKDQTAVHVQKGVYYSPSVKFYAFDIVSPRHSFLTFDQFVEVCETAGFLYSKPLQRGDFGDLVKFDYQSLVTTLPEAFGLPPLVDYPNIAEGVVLRPVKNAYLSNGDRVIVKLKSDEFKEVSGMVKGVGKIPGHRNVSPPEDTEILEHYSNMARYINENRLRAVISKIGDIKFKDRGPLVGNLVQDAMEDYSKDVPSWAHLSKQRQKSVTKKIQQLAANLTLLPCPSEPTEEINLKN